MHPLAAAEEIANQARDSDRAAAAVATYIDDQSACLLQRGHGPIHGPIKGLRRRKADDFDVSHVAVKDVRPRYTALGPRRRWRRRSDRGGARRADAQVLVLRDGTQVLC